MQVRTLDQLTASAHSPAFVCYVLVVAPCLAACLCHVSPRYGRRHVLVYVTVCSLFGALSVLCAKVLALGLQVGARGLVFDFFLRGSFSFHFCL